MQQRIALYILSLFAITVPAGHVTSVSVAVFPSAAAEPASKGQAPASGGDPVTEILQPVSAWLERANREYQDNVVHPLSVPTGTGSPLEAQQPKTETAQKPVIVRPGEPTLLGQIKGLLGLEQSPPPEPPPLTVQDAKQRKDREEAVQRQIEARVLEQQRNAEQQQLALEAKKSAELTDAATKQRQKAAEAARIAAQDGQKSSAAPEVATVKPTAPAKSSDEVKKADAAASAAEASRIAERAAADKKAATADEAKRTRDAAAVTEREQKRKAAVAAESAKRLAQANKPPDADRPAVIAPAAPQPPAADKPKAKSAEPSAADRLADEANKAGSKALEKLEQRNKSGTKVASHAKSHKSLVSSRGSSNGGGSRGDRCARAGRDIELPAIYVVKSGDTLWDISRRYYDKGYKFEKIVRANESKISSPDLIFPCQKFYLPARSALFWAIPLEDDTDAG